MGFAAASARLLQDWAASREVRSAVWPRGSSDIPYHRDRTTGSDLMRKEFVAPKLVEEASLATLTLVPATSGRV